MRRPGNIIPNAASLSSTERTGLCHKYIGAPVISAAERSGAAPDTCQRPWPQRPRTLTGGGAKRSRVNYLAAQLPLMNMASANSRHFEGSADRAFCKQCRASRHLCSSPPVSGC